MLGIGPNPAVAGPAGTSFVFAAKIDWLGAFEEMISVRLVLLPGLDGTAKLFTPFIKALPEHIDVVTIAFPTDRDLSYSELQRHLGFACPCVEPFVLLAESFSTPLAVQFAATAPVNMCGVVLCAGFVASPVRGWRRVMGELFAPLLVRLPLPGFAVRLWLLGRSAPANLVAAVRAAVSSVRPRVLSARLKAVLTCDVRLNLGKIAVPIHYITAKNDRLIEAICVRDVQQSGAQIDVVWVEGPSSNGSLTKSRK